jgi:hypothetical protein
MSKHGDYRPLYCSFWDDADIHAMSDEAYRVLTTLKGTLPAAGIGIVYQSVLAERCGMLDRLEALELALNELEEPRTGRDCGWIIREKNVIWIVRGLYYEPSILPSNKKHRAYLRDRVLGPLGSAPIVTAFQREYAEWFDEPYWEAVEAEKKATGKGIEGVSKQHSSSNPSPNPSQDLTARRLAPPAQDDPEKAQLWAAIRAHLRTPDGVCPAGFSDARDGSILKALRKHHSTSALLSAIEGVGILRDHPGQYADVVDWLKPGTKVTLRALYSTSSGVLPLFSIATQAYHKHAEASKPRPAAAKPTGIADVVASLVGPYAEADAHANSESAKREAAERALLEEYDADFLARIARFEKERPDVYRREQDEVFRQLGYVGRTDLTENQYARVEEMLHSRIRDSQHWPTKPQWLAERRRNSREKVRV